MENKPCVIKITLSGDKVTIVDEADFEWLNKWRWSCSNGYVYRTEKGQSISMHRLITNCPKGMCVDHINGDCLDNRRQNLRICTNQQNVSRQKVQNRFKSSIYKGVSWNKNLMKWIAQIKFNRRLIFIGYFQNERHAEMAYDIWAKDLFKEFALLNF